MPKRWNRWEGARVNRLFPLAKFWRNAAPDRSCHALFAKVAFFSKVAMLVSPQQQSDHGRHLEARWAFSSTGSLDFSGALCEDQTERRSWKEACPIGPLLLRDRNLPGHLCVGTPRICSQSRALYIRGRGELHVYEYVQSGKRSRRSQSFFLRAYAWRRICSENLQLHRSEILTLSTPWPNSKRWDIFTRLSWINRPRCLLLTDRFNERAELRS